MPFSLGISWDDHMGNPGWKMVCRVDDMGFSENVVCLNPMVLLISFPMKWLFSWGYHSIICDNK